MKNQYLKLSIIFIVLFALESKGETNNVIIDRPIKKSKKFEVAVLVPLITLDMTNVTGAGGVYLKYFGMFTGWEILDVTNTLLSPVCLKNR